MDSSVHYLDRQLVNDLVVKLQTFLSQTQEHEREAVKQFLLKHNWRLFCFSDPLRVCFNTVRDFCCCRLPEPVPVKRLEDLIDVFVAHGKLAQSHRERVSLTEYISRNAKNIV